MGRRGILRTRLAPVAVPSYADEERVCAGQHQQESSAHD